MTRGGEGDNRGSAESLRELLPFFKLCSWTLIKLTHSAHPSLLQLTVQSARFFLSADDDA